MGRLWTGCPRILDRIGSLAARRDRFLEAKASGGRTLRGGCGTVSWIIFIDFAKNNLIFKDAIYDFLSIP